MDYVVVPNPFVFYTTAQVLYYNGSCMQAPAIPLQAISKAWRKSSEGGAGIMKYVVASIGSYGKGLLRKLGLCQEGPSLQTSEWQAGGTLRAERRREARRARISPCTYGLMRSVDRNGVTLEEGRGTTVNESPGGMRLLLGIAPQRGHLLEVQTAPSTFRYGFYLAEVCWTKLLREDEQGAIYLVGCRLKFGATHFQVF